MDIAQVLTGELKKQALSQIAKQIGGDNKMAQAMIEKTLPSVLEGLEKNTQTEDGKKALDTGLEKHTGGRKIDLADGAKILGHILGNNTESEVENIAKAT